MADITKGPIPDIADDSAVVYAIHRPPREQLSAVDGGGVQTVFLL